MNLYHFLTNKNIHGFGHLVFCKRGPDFHFRILSRIRPGKKCGSMNFLFIFLAALWIVSRWSRLNGKLASAYLLVMNSENLVLNKEPFCCKRARNLESILRNLRKKHSQEVGSFPLGLSHHFPKYKAIRFMLEAWRGAFK